MLAHGELGSGLAFHLFTKSLVTTFFIFEADKWNFKTFRVTPRGESQACLLPLHVKTKEPLFCRGDKPNLKKSEKALDFAKTLPYYYLSTIFLERH